MKRNFWLLIIIVVLSCSRRDKLPDRIMKEQEMISFLVELHTIQSQVQNLRLPADSSEILFIVLEKDLLSKMNVRDSTFYESFSWYLDHADMMYDIYSAVVDSLSLRNSLVRKVEE